MSDRGAIVRIPHLLARNAGIEFSDDSSKRLRVQGRGDSTTVNMGYTWEGAKTIHEVMDAVHNYEAITFMYRYATPVQPL